MEDIIINITERVASEHGSFTRTEGIVFAWMMGVVDLNSESHLRARSIPSIPVHILAFTGTMLGMRDTQRRPSDVSLELFAVRGQVSSRSVTDSTSPLSESVLCAESDRIRLFSERAYIIRPTVRRG